MTAEKYSFKRYLNVRYAYGASFSQDGKRLSINMLGNFNNGITVCSLLAYLFYIWYA